MSDAELILWGSLGIFPGPLESVESFMKRARKDATSCEAGDNSLLLPLSLFSISPHWIKIHYDSKNLSLWEAAATWIQETKEGEIDYFIQIHPSRKIQSKEVLAHEMVHAVRMGFEEPYFEEVLAYQVSSNFLRRYFGPLFIRTYQIKIFIGLLLLSWSLVILDAVFEFHQAFHFFSCLPFLFLTGCLIRLILLQKTFHRCLKNLTKVMDPSKTSLAMALRLTDAEIKRFAKASPSEIENYILCQKEKSLRWRQIYLEFFAL